MIHIQINHTWYSHDINKLIVNHSPNEPNQVIDINSCKYNNVYIILYFEQSRKSSIGQSPILVAKVETSLHFPDIVQLCSTFYNIE